MSRIRMAIGGNSHSDSAESHKQARVAIDGYSILLCSGPSLLLIRAGDEHFIKRSDYSARILDV